MLTGLGIILQHIHRLNHYVVYLKLTHVNYISIKNNEKQPKQVRVSVQHKPLGLLGFNKKISTVTNSHNSQNAQNRNLPPET